MHRINVAAPALALSLLLTGCTGPVSDQAAPGGQNEVLYTRTATDEEAFGPLEDAEPADNRSDAPAEPVSPPAETVPDQPKSGEKEDGAETEPAEPAETGDTAEPPAAPQENPADTNGTPDDSGTPDDHAADTPAPPEPVREAEPPAENAPAATAISAETASAPVTEKLLHETAVPLTDTPMLLPVAAGTAVKTGGGAEIDYSNIADGYVMARFASANSKRLRVQIVGPKTTYVYDLPTGGWVTFPLSDGNGNYKTTVLQNTEGKKYAVLASVTFQVTLANEFAPFLRPNQYVDYSGAANTVSKAQELTKSASGGLDKVGKVYDFVVGNLTYDKDKAESVQSGYLPVLDTVLAAKKGICFDYAALMTGMLRSQGIPCKLVVGYAGTQYHAWVSVWTEETGWVDNAIYFDGTTWHRMDPTFASSGNSSESIMKYIGDGKNYTVKYLY